MAGAVFTAAVLSHNKHHSLILLQAICCARHTVAAPVVSIVYTEAAGTSSQGGQAGGHLQT